MGRLVCVRGAGAVRVAGDELLALLAFVVHRVAQHARKRREEEHETTAKDKDAAGKIEPFAARDLWEESISLGSRAPGLRPMIVVSCGRVAMGGDD